MEAETGAKTQSEPSDSHFTSFP